MAPGKEVELYEWNIHLRPKGATSKNLLTIHGTGKFSLQCERIVGPTSANPNHSRSHVDKLATGKLELEVKEPEKQPQKEEKEAVTAWGKEVGGLQAGLGYAPGQKRAYSHGETVTLVVRVRNVGKKEVKFQYVSQFLIEIPPTVTDGKGNRVPPALRTLFGIHLPKDVNLAPGKEVELYGELEIRPDFGTGKVSIQYERVLGDSSSARIKLDPILSKLATGKLELDVKEPEKQPQPKQPAKSDQERMVGNWFIMNDDSRRKGEMWVINEDRILMHANYGGSGSLMYFHRLDARQGPQANRHHRHASERSARRRHQGSFTLLDGDELRLCLGAWAKIGPRRFPRSRGRAKF